MKFKVFILASLLTFSIFINVHGEKNDSTFSFQIKAIIDSARLNFGIDNELSFRLSQKALQLSRKHKIKKLEASSLNLFGYYHLYISEPDKAIKYFERSLLLYQTINDTTGISYEHYMIGQANYYLGNYKNAMNHYEYSLSLTKKLNDSAQIASLLYEIGYIKYSQSNFKIALKYFYDGLEIIEKTGKGDNLKNSFYTSIGDIYFEWGEFEKAKKYFTNALSLSLKNGNIQGKAWAINNIGNVYLKQKQYESALEKYNEAKAIFENSNYLQGVSITLNNIGMTNEDMGNNLKAIRFYEESVRIKKDVGDKAGISKTLGIIGDLLINEGEYNQAILKIEKSQEIAFSLNLQTQIKENYRSLSKAYKLLGNNSKSLDYFEKFFTLHDSLFNANTQQQFTEMQTRFETEQKEKEIELLNKEKVLQKTELLQKNEILSKQKAIITIIIIGFLLVLTFSIVIYRMFRQKKIANEILKQQKEEILAQRDEIASQRDQIEDKNIAINSINRDLTASIRYALRIQQALLPDAKTISKLLGEHFLLYLPKDIVSGDFYWITSRKELDGTDTIILACADCTGHGVPGAFMSIVGMNLLEKAVYTERLIHPSDILNFITNNIYSLIRHSSDKSELKDGMDIALCVFNRTKRKLEFAGARNSLIIISDDKLTEIKGDKHFIGDLISTNSLKGYTNHHLNLNQDDLIYMYSDGFADQFGGQNRKKFMTARLKDILNKNHHRSLEYQGEVLLKEHFNWKKNEAQIDDILVLGLKI